MLTLTTSDFPSPSEILSSEFLGKYVGKHPNWGFNGLGYVVAKRTYMRLLELEGRTEEWWETVERCIRGAQKIGACYTVEEAERLYDHVFNLRCNFAGRSLWQLNTSTVDRFGANSLINCFFTIISCVEDFNFVFENLMLGSGVGGSVRREHVHEFAKVKKDVCIIHKATKDADFIVPDSREGWVELLRKVLNAYFTTGQSFSYSTILIRGYGEKIGGFGGTASGPQILIDGIANICSILEKRAGKKIRSVDALDVFNIIASIVVAGNVRRSSEIALGDADDILFLRAKRWDLGNIPNWRAMSNNTIVADSFDYTSPEFWNGYNGNGEPYGLFNLELSKTQGRLGEFVNDNCEGTNPCFAGDTRIACRNGSFCIQDLVGQTAEIWDGNEWVKIDTFRVTSENQEVFEIGLSGGDAITATAYHEFILEDTQVKTLSELKVGDKLRIANCPNYHNVKKPDNFNQIITIAPKGIADKVYCCTVHTNSSVSLDCNILTRQCSEISLADGEACNLSELYLNNISSPEELLDCAKLLYKTQKAICAMTYLHEKTNKIIHKNMRIGIGVTGICQSLDKIEWLDNTYNKLREYDREWSKKRGWNSSIKISTVKPSGSLSLLAGSTPGIHPAYDRYYIRRVRMSSLDPLVETCKKLGYTTEFVKNFDGTFDHKTTVVEFPCECTNALLAKDVTAIQQLELVKKIQTVWADNAVSVTVYYKPDELPEIKEWLKENYESSIKAVSFLRHQEHGFQQAPYESITEDVYRKRISQVKPLSEIVNDTGGNLIEASDCQGGACPVR